MATEELHRRVVTMAEEARDPAAVVLGINSKALYAMLDGKFDQAIAYSDEVLRVAEHGGAPARGRLQRAGVATRALLYTGRPHLALTYVDATTGPANWFQRPICLAADGQVEPAKVAIETAWRERHTDDPFTPAGLVLGLLEACVAARYLPRLADLARRCAPLAGRSSFGGTPFTSTPGRHLGAAAALLGDPAQARSYYAQALEAAGKIRFRPEIALTRLGLAELLLDHYPTERAEALGHLDFAIGEFRDMKMQPSLERALKRKEILKA